MATNLTEYKRQKGLLPKEDFGTMFYFESNRQGCSEIKEILIWNKKSNIGKIYPSANFYTKYEFKEVPYDCDIEDGTNYSMRSYGGSGIGDLWSYSNWCSLNKEELEKLREKELQRITEKYLKPQEESKIIQSKKELLDCIHILMAILDTPVGRLHNKGDFADSARNIGRKILSDNNINLISHE